MEHYVKEAVGLAIQGRWEEAVVANREILRLFPDDVETYNRLGRALMEIGDYAAAREAYGRALELDSYNNIAKKNLKRLSELGQPAQKEKHHKVVVDVFVEETSKARTTSLVKLAPRDVLARMAPGEEISLQVEEQQLIAKSAQDEYLGEVEPKYGLRLAKLIKGGNRYTAVITNLGEGKLKVLISEVYQHPSQTGRLSFPPKKREGFRPYVKERLLRQRAEEETDEDLEAAEPEMEGFSEVDF
jgi:tetratricopeptide (TPR) repeat protein